MQHYIAYSFSSPPGRDVFATRATVGCALFYLYDAALRLRYAGDNEVGYKFEEEKVCDMPLSLLITGSVGAPMMMPVYGCGLSSKKGPVRDIGDVTSTYPVSDPRVAAKRAACLDYSMEQRRAFGPDAPELFRFNGETCVQDSTFLFSQPCDTRDFQGTQAFLLALTANLGIGDTDMPPVIRDGAVGGLEKAAVEALTVFERMAGWFADLGEAIPELKQVRDMALWARLLLEPSQAQNGLSPRIFSPLDAQLKWQFEKTDAAFKSLSKGDKCYFKVKGFGMKLTLGCDPPSNEASPLGRFLEIPTADGRGVRRP